MVVPLPKSELYRIVGRSTRLTRDTDLTFPVFQSMVSEIAGTDFGMRDPNWLSTYGDAARIAASYRVGRAFLAGDAAHIHLPAGGVGMNVGIQNAANLAWRLADVVKGYAPESMLDGYGNERRPVGLELLISTQAQAAVQNFTPDGLALRTLLSGLIASVPEFSRALAERLCGFSVDYHVAGDGHRLTGVRALDLTLLGGQNLFAALIPAQPVLLARPGALDEAVQTAAAGAAIAVHELPDFSDRADWRDVRAALIRPDGYVAWASDESGEQLNEGAREAITVLRPNAPVGS